MDPETDTEQTLASIWLSLLGEDQINRQDNFFDLGGHSLKAIQLMSRVRVCLSIDMPVRWLFENPVLMELSERIDTHRSNFAERQ